MIESHKLKNRARYLNKLIGFQDTAPVKVITGIRRCGKSEITMRRSSYLLTLSLTLPTTASNP